MTANACAYTKVVTFRQILADLGVKIVRIRPCRPQTNGKVERFNRTLLEEWAYVRTYRSNHARTRALDRVPTPTITNDPTRRSAAEHPCQASTTLQGIAAKSIIEYAGGVSGTTLASRWSLTTSAQSRGDSAA